MLRSTHAPRNALAFLPAALLASGVLVAWGLAANGEWARLGLLPSPRSVWNAFLEELARGRLVDDVVASLFRMACGYGLAAAVGIPAGLFLGVSARARATFLPYVNFFKGLSPLAWLPFAVLWFGIGDGPAVFLIFLGTVFPLCVSSLSAATRVPETHFRVAKESGFSRAETFFRVVFPSALPEIMGALRVAAGVAWMVIVPAEMLSGRDGLGFAVMDARNGLRIDLLVTYMILIGLIGILLDRGLQALSRMEALRWGHERK